MIDTNSTEYQSALAIGLIPHDHSWSPLTPVARGKQCDLCGIKEPWTAAEKIEAGKRGLAWQQAAKLEAVVGELERRFYDAGLQAKRSDRSWSWGSSRLRVSGVTVYVEFESIGGTWHRSTNYDKTVVVVDGYDHNARGGRYPLRKDGSRAWDKIIDAVNRIAQAKAEKEKLLQRQQASYQAKKALQHRLDEIESKIMVDGKALCVRLLARETASGDGLVDIEVSYATETQAEQIITALKERFGCGRIRGDVF